MRFSPKKILHGLLCTTPILVLTLAACGGGGGGSTTSTPPLAAAYTVGGTVSGVTAAGLVLRNNGGDDKAISSVDATYTFATSVVAGKSYNVTVLTNPSNQLCSVANASKTMPAYNVTNANVSCVPAFTISGTIDAGNPLTSSGLVLQDNNGDNLLVPANATTFKFNTPVPSGGNSTVTVLTQPNTPSRLKCTVSSTGQTGIGADVTNVFISCPVNSSPLPDRYAYTADNGVDTTVSAYAITAGTGMLTASVKGNAGSGPSAVVADAASHVYAVNQMANTISGFSITDIYGGLTPLSDVDGGTAGLQGSIATGPAPVAIAIHPSGKFAYVVNSGGGSSAADANSVSAYSIDASGALARIDTDGDSAGTQYFIPTKVNPVSIAIDPAGTHAYVTNYGSGNISVYSIDATSGALKAIQTTTNSISDPYSIAIDPTDMYAYVTSWNTDSVYIYPITGGTLNTSSPQIVSTGTTGSGPRAIAIDPSGTYAYVVNSGSSDIAAYTLSGATLSPLNCLSNCSLGSNPHNFPAGNQPISIAIDSSGQYAYVANSGSNSIWAYHIASGALNPVDSQATGINPHAVTTVR
jgi:6-phosphogluconolactonase (cycloisomerase 2 family)